MVNKLLIEQGLENAKQIYDDDVSMGSFISFNAPVYGALMLDSLATRLFSNLKFLVVDEVPQEFYRIYMVYNKKHNHSRAVKDFIQFARTYQGNGTFDDEEQDA